MLLPQPKQSMVGGSQLSSAAPTRSASPVANAHAVWRDDVTSAASTPPSPQVDALRHIRQKARDRKHTEKFWRQYLGDILKIKKKKKRPLSKEDRDKVSRFNLMYTRYELKDGRIPSTAVLNSLRHHATRDDVNRTIG